MFREAYERKLNGNYLILEEEHPPVDKNEFESRMLQENNIPGFLRCTVRYVDGREQFAYDITSRQSLKRIYEEQDIGYRDMKSILLGMMKGFDAVSEYFLNEENLILLPEYIYLDIETKQAFLCLYPYYHVNIRSSFQHFSEYLLQKTDHTDEKAVVLAYAFYKQIANEDYDLYHLFEKAAIRKTENYGDAGMTAEYKIPAGEITKYETAEKGANAYGTGEEVPESGGCAREMDTDRTDDKAEKRIFFISASVLLLLTGFVLYMEIYEPAAIMALLPYETLTVLIAAAGAATLFSSVMLLGRQRKKRRALEREQRRERMARQQMNGEQEEVLAEKSYCGKTGAIGQGEEPVRRLVRFEKEGITEFKLCKTPFIIGKKKAVADGVLTDPAISRMHAKIYRERNNYYLMDLNSTNGTSKNGRRLNANESTVLAYNDEISFAGELFYFR